MNSRLLTLALAAGLGFAAAGTAQAEKRKTIREALDLDGNGALSRDEMRAAPKSLAGLDADEDGRLNWREIGTQVRGGRGFSRPRRDAEPTPPPLRSPFDGNRDGSIDGDEMAAGFTVLRGLDGNRDGQLSAREFDHVFPPPDAGARFDMSAMRGRRGETREQVMPKDLKPEDGMATIPDQATYAKLSYRGENVLIDTFLKNLEFVKFQLSDATGDNPLLYFMNTNKYRAHMMFMSAMGISRGRMGFGRRSSQTFDGPISMRGQLIYRPMVAAPDGSAGLFTFDFQPNDAFPFRYIKFCYDILSERAPVVRGRLAFQPRNRGIDLAKQEAAEYEKAGIPIFAEEDKYTKVAFLPLHKTKSFGRLRLMTQKERPGARDVVVYTSLPNELPRVAGILTDVRQTPLSHVNLRAVQDNVPNAFIKGASKKPEVAALFGKYVMYEVRDDGYTLREATAKEVETHFAALRPKETQSPVRDLSMRKIRSLDELQHTDWKSVGVKAANLAVLKRLDLPVKTVATGYAIPFSFYDTFMRHNDLYEAARKMMAKKGFATDDAKRRKALSKLRKQIEKSTPPEAMMEALSALQSKFEIGTKIRCRSSTNNEDLPKFSGAGLYDSFTHRPDEGHLSRTVKQVWSSLWNFRAFEERDFYRIDHFETAMAVLVHPNFDAELANGVAVSDDVVYGTENKYYVNTQIGEDLVTNPDPNSIPEETLLSRADFRWDRTLTFASGSRGESLLSGVHVDDLRESLAAIEKEFRKLYGLLPHALFAVEVEFKITSKKKMAIKQARPWIY